MTENSPSFRLEPFLWIHLCGLAVLPLLLEVVWLGLAVGKPSPFWLELGAIALIGIVPVFGMQWYRPFDIFSILLLSVKPEQLEPQQRQILQLFKTPKHRILTLLGALIMLAILWGLYRVAPVAAALTPLPPRWHWAGIAIAAIAYGLANLFLQVPIGVIGVLLTSEERFEQIDPLTPEAIRQGFFIPGLRVNRLLPPLKLEEESPEQPAAIEKVEETELEENPWEESPPNPEAAEEVWDKESKIDPQASEKEPDSTTPETE